jgi:membrane associated rhomboid family serine protease
VFPYRDNLVAGAYPWAVIALVAVLTLVNVPLFIVDSWQQAAIDVLGFFPNRFSINPLSTSYRLVTATLLHGNGWHLAGNCLFLVVFGRTLERLLGARTILGLFPALGVAGFLLHWALYPDSPNPVIGASGAIAFLMGAYLPLFPNARIRMVLFLGFLWKRFTVPAWVFLPYWIILQLISLAIGTGDGVAYAVHAGSFAAGFMSAIVWKTSYPLAEEKLAIFTTESFKPA